MNRNKKDQDTHSCPVADFDERPPFAIGLTGAGTVDLSSEEHRTNNGYDDPHLGLSFGHTFIEKILIAIIKANGPSNGYDRRLKMAMRALFNKEPTHGVTINDEQDRKLLWMASEKHRLEALAFIHDQDKPNITAIELARAAFVRFKDNSNANSREEQIKDLARKFNGTTKTAKKSFNRGLLADRQATIMYRANEHDYISESLEMQGLRKVREVLKNFGVPMMIDEPKAPEHRERDGDS